MFNEAHWHLVFNHFPIMGSFFGTLVLGGGIIAKNKSVRITAFLIIIFSALMAVPAFLTGEGASEIIKELDGMNPEVIENHENLAEISIWSVQILGLLAIFAIYSEQAIHKTSRILTLICFVFSLFNMALLTRVGNTGGEIRHSEIRNDQPLP